jgi:hypothetical protein
VERSAEKRKKRKSKGETTTTSIWNGKKRI